MSPWLPLRCLWPSLLGTRMGVATSNEVRSRFRPKCLENSECWNKLKGEWWHIEALKSCSRTGTPDVATAQQGRSTSIDPVTTVCSAPFPPTAWKKGKKKKKTHMDIIWLNSYMLSIKRLLQLPSFQSITREINVFNECLQSYKYYRKKGIINSTVLSVFWFFTLP